MAKYEKRIKKRREHHREHIRDLMEDVGNYAEADDHGIDLLADLMVEYELLSESSMVLEKRIALRIRLTSAINRTRESLGLTKVGKRKGPGRPRKNEAEITPWDDIDV